MHLFFACPSCSHSPLHTFCCVATTSKKHLLVSAQLFTYCHPTATPHNTQYNMNFDEQDNTQNQFQSWHRKKNIKCPSCKSSLFHFDRMSFFSSVRIINDIVLIHHSQCQSSIVMCRKDLSTFACPVGVKACIHLGDYKIKDAKKKMPFCRKPMKG